MSAPFQVPEPEVAEVEDSFVPVQSSPADAPDSSEKQKKASRPREAPSQTSRSKPTPSSPAFDNKPQAILELDGPVSNLGSGKTLVEIATEVARPEIKAAPTPTTKKLSGAKQAGLLRRLGHGILSFLTSNKLDPFQKDLNQINQMESATSQLKTPAQFLAKTETFKQRLADGESLADIRNEAYAVARQASVVALGMRPYDVQVLGALAMDDGHIAEMRTGEGKTLTALMPLYLNALAGQGAHLVTVNDTLASRDAKEMGPAFELLGLTVGTVLEDMKKDEKRAGYKADVTYTTDRALGFDYLRDMTATNPAQRMQREPFFALVDEVDEVLIDEARSPLIISGAGSSHQKEYQLFNEILSELKPGADYYFDKQKHTAAFSDTGHVRIENKLLQRELLQELKSADPERAVEIRKELSQRATLSELISAEQRESDELRDTKGSKPGWWSRLRGVEWDDSILEQANTEHSEAARKVDEMLGKLPRLNLFDDENAHRTRFLYASLKAHALFKAGKDYTVSGGKVEIVDQNKGRTSEGRRYNDGVHQGLEAKHGVPIQDDSRTTATITYPNLFKRYPRLSGMSGTAKTSEYEFLKLYELDVIQVPTNEPVIRDDKPDMVFKTLDEKFEAIADDAYQDFTNGRPILIGTLSVEHNEWLAKQLLAKGVPPESLQILNAETVRGDKEGENEMISQAGRSGVITVATNLAGRGANIKPDLINFQKLAKSTVEQLNQDRQVVVSVGKEKEAKWLQSWLAGIPSTVVPASERGGPQQSPVQIRYSKGVDDVVEPPLPENAVHLDGADFPTNGLKVYGTERSFSRRIDDQLIGRSGRQGAPGESQFYLSLEDDLFRVFGAKHIDSVLGLFLEPNQGVQNEIVDKVISEIQGAVEMEHFSSREASNKQDEVLNAHRDAFFAIREELFQGDESMVGQFEEMVGNALSDTTFSHLPKKSKHQSLGEYKEAVKKAEEELGVSIDLPFLRPDSSSADTEKMSREDFEYEVRDFANRQVRKIARTLQKMPGDGDATLRPMLLAPMDQVWTEHLQAVDLLHTGMQWQSLAQKDPETQFKLAAWPLFEESLHMVDCEVTKGPYKEMLQVADLLESLSSTP